MHQILSFIFIGSAQLKLVSKVVFLIMEVINKICFRIKYTSLGSSSLFSWFFQNVSSSGLRPICSWVFREIWVEIFRFFFSYFSEEMPKAWNKIILKFVLGDIFFMSLILGSTQQFLKHVAILTRQVCNLLEDLWN